MAIWFRHLLTDREARRNADLKGQAFVIAAKQRNRKIIIASSIDAEQKGICKGMVVADAKALLSSLIVQDERPGQNKALLTALGEWCIRYSPVVAVNEPDGLLLDISGCAHLWGGEREYLKEIILRLRGFGYDTRGAIADTIGAAWAVSRYGKVTPIIDPGAHRQALLPFPPAALRLPNEVLEKMYTLGMGSIESFCDFPHATLRRRFGKVVGQRIRQAFGHEQEFLAPLEVPAEYNQRLPSLEPIRTRAGIEISIRKLLEMLCQQVGSEGKGIRTAVLTCYRIDHRLIRTEIGTNLSTCNQEHLFRLFELKISGIAPGLGIELFVLEATATEPIDEQQEKLWTPARYHDQELIAGLLDRVAAKVGNDAVHRYLPDEHYWPERSIRQASSFAEKPTISWPRRLLRPMQMLKEPQPIQVSAPIPDYPPMLFVYRDVVHEIKKADGPERIEPEWWIDEGLHRDYYILEDQKGARYWVFRLGHYGEDQNTRWFIHGFFA